MGLIAALRSWLSGPDPSLQPAVDSSESSSTASSPVPAKSQPARAVDGSVDRPAATPTPAGSAPAPTGHGESVVAARQERLASRLLDDERLRADLTDDAYQPILDWAVGVSDRMAASTASLDDAAAEPVLDQQSAALKELVGAIVQAVGAYESGDAPARGAALRKAARLATGSALSAFLGASDQAKRRPLSRFERASASGRSDGPELARRIVAALSPASHATRPSESEAS